MTKLYLVHRLAVNLASNENNKKSCHDTSIVQRISFLQNVYFPMGPSISFVNLNVAI